MYIVLEKTIFYFIHIIKLSLYLKKNQLYQLLSGLKKLANMAIIRHSDSYIGQVYRSRI